MTGLIDVRQADGVGFAEELAFRGYLFQTLRERMPAWAAAGLSAVIFVAYHLTLGGFGPGFVATVICLALTIGMISTDLGPASFETSCRFVL